jgi:cell division septum initiation protein DivIVA
MDDVVVELIRCKTDNETLKQKIVDLNKEIYQLKNEVNSYKSVGFGLYRKKEIYIWE